MNIPAIFSAVGGVAIGLGLSAVLPVTTPPVITGTIILVGTLLAVSNVFELGNG
jgi:hypothetical protein